MQKNNYSNFNKSGYILEKNFLTKHDKNKVLRVLKKNLSKYVPYLKKKTNLENTEFHQQILKLRKRKRLFGELYDKINLSSDLRNIFYQDKFLNKFKQILKSEDVFLNGFMVRFDAPFDKRNSLDWHQDSPYYMQTYPKFNAGVCWLPVTNNSEKNGSLQFIKNSNKKFLKSSFSNNDKYTTSQFSLNVPKKQQKHLVNLNQKFGDISFLHMNLKHRSGVNSSKKMRITIACRFHCMKHFNVGKEIYFYNDKYLRKNDKYIIKKK